jgi:hypothetical protein
MVLQTSELPIIFTSVFHRILDFKSGVEFLFRPFFYFMPVMPDKQVSQRFKIKSNGWGIRGKPNFFLAMEVCRFQFN